MIELITHWFLTVGPTLAYIIFFAIIFAESGLIVAFFLPGDSLLFTMGIFASQGNFNIAILLILGVIGAIAGDSVGYYFGRSVGHRIFTPDSKRKYLNHEDLLKAHAFYEKYGAKTIILARFVPFVRCFAPILAGVSEMNYKVFVTYNVIGGVFWVCSVTLAGYFLGQVIPNIEAYILPIIALIVIVSIIPALGSYFKKKK